jgi:hypothetical protein
MKTIPAILSALLLSALTLSAAEESATAIDAARSHLGAFLRADAEKLEASYAPQVTLMPGHEFLKPSYGLTEKEGRNEATRVERGKLVEAISDAAKEQPERPAGKISALIESLAFTVVETREDQAAIAPADPVGTADGKLRFDIKQGDVVVKAAPQKGDFILYHLRSENGAWHIVSEYLD